ncbi:hypothetical protein [Streptomyces sp. JJ36]|uniref:hypothetical protein n=1 Tax=Streptomyces sp. JJ36 TaxID=2736645 RepID=UPI001F2CC1EA|nr:hypothetical protein [Streptomyces sp. JJ36]MCF6523825.1 hypothetical protein [Streptomyces sp. JJ36]
MHEITQDEWKAALSTLYEDEYVFVGAAGRKHRDWAHDVTLVMLREVSDPRGWQGQDWDAEEVPGQPPEPKGHPFENTDPSAIEKHLFEVTKRTATRQLVAMIDEWFTMHSIPDYERRKGELDSSAAALLSRFGPHARFYSSAADARPPRSPDFDGSMSSGRCFTCLLMDLGLVAVSEDEVGVFWRFNAY